MTNLFQALTRRGGAKRSSALSLDEWLSYYFTFNGLDYQVLTGGSLVGDKETIDASFSGYVQGAYKRNGVVFACMAARLLIFSEARFQWRRLQNGRPGELFGTSALELLEEPWPGATTGDLLARMITDVDLAGNFFGTRRPGAPGGKPWIERLRPDWVTIITGSRSGNALDRELIGYAFQPGGPGSGEEVVALLPEQVAHFAPIPDPEARYRGMSWLTPVLREITSDGAATAHKQRFYEQGATPNLVLVNGQTNLTPEAFEKWVDKMEASHTGVRNAFRTIYLAAGSDAKIVGSNFKDADFKAVQGAGETRIAAAARIPPVIVGLSEGLSAATYSNYAQAKRAFADGTIRPLWRNAAGVLQKLLDTPAGAQLWYDDRDIPFLQEDRRDAAEIQATEALTIRTLLDAGFEPESVKLAVLAEDWGLLKHSGLFSVQLHPPGAVDAPAAGGTPALEGANALRELLAKAAAARTTTNGNGAARALLPAANDQGT